MKKFIRSFLLFVTMLFSIGFLSACGAPAITAISITNIPQFIEVGDEYTLSATLTPSGASQADVSWSSSNTKVATIDNNGKIKALSSGTTQITAMSKKNSNIKDTISLNVFGQDQSVILLGTTYTYDGTAKSCHASSVEEELEIRYTYSNANYEESEFEPINAGTYTVKAYNKVTGTLLAQATMTINPKKAYLSINSYTKKYSKDDPAFAATITGLVGDDRIQYTLSRTSGEAVGSYTITAHITESTNYDIITSNGSLKIDPLEVKIEADNKSSIYGDSIVDTTYTLKALDNTILSDTLKLQIFGNLKIEMPESQGRLAVGSYTISCDDLSSTNLSIINTKNGTYTVSKRTATVSVSAGQYKYSGDSDPKIQYSINGTQEGDDLTGCLTRASGENVGFYEYILDQTLNTNYNLVFNESMSNYSFEIKSNEIQIAFNDFQVDYSLENAEGVIPADKYLYTISKNGQSVDYTLDASGKIYLNNTDAILLTHNVSKELTLSDAEKQSFYQKWKVALEKSSTEGYDDPVKYTFTFVDGYKYIKLIPLTITADPATKIYGDSDPTFTYTASGFLNEDNSDNVIKNIELKRETGDNVATYKITLKGDVELFENKAYYKTDFVDGTFEITTRELRVKPVSYTGDNSIYYGEAPKELTIDENDLNLAPRDTLSRVLGGELTRANNENVGSYTIQGTSLELLSTNYTLVYTPGIYTIIPRPIIVIAIDTNVQYGETVQKYQYSYTVVEDFISEDDDGEEYTEYREYVTDLFGKPTFTGSLSLTHYGVLYVNDASNPYYTIGQGNLTCGSNFTIQYSSGKLTVSPREVTIAFSAQSYGFTEYNQDNPTPSFTASPSLAYSDVCTLTMFQTTSTLDSNIISLLKDSDGNYIASFEFTTSGGKIINDCYSVHIDENYTELFYLGASLIDITIGAKGESAEDSSTITKTYGDNYNLLDNFELTTTLSGYIVEYGETTFNIKGYTDSTTYITPSTCNLNAGTYTVSIFVNSLRIYKQSATGEKEGEDVSNNFAVNIKSYASLVVEKAVLTTTTEPTLKDIVFGTEKPVFNGGTYTFTKQDEDTVTIVGTNEEYSTADTSSYSVTTSGNEHLIMATFTPKNTNFKSVVHENLELTVTKAVLDTSVLEWKYGVAVTEDNAEVDGNIYTIHANIEGANHITYIQDSIEENVYYIPTTLHNYRFLRQTITLEHLYVGVAFKDDATDTGFMYYIDNGTIKKVFPKDSDNFFAEFDKSTGDVQLFYNDGSKDYLLTNSATLAGNGKPTYSSSIYAPETSGVFFARARISSLSNNYSVVEDKDAQGDSAKINYYNLFLVKKVLVRVFNFTTKITYDTALTFNYITDPQNITGKVIKFFKKNADETYTELSENPTDVGDYACTFIIDQANYYYYKEYSDFSIVPVNIVVEWGSQESFSFISTETPITREFSVYANDVLVFKTNNSNQIPEWLSITYLGTRANGDKYPSTGIPTGDIPSNAGDYTIYISAISDGTHHNYVGSYSNTYSITPKFYEGSITIQRASITYDIAYTNGQEGAINFYNKIYESMVRQSASENIEEFNVVLTYSGYLIDPTGNERTFVSLLNKAGGPYKITMTISSRDGNYKETIKSANLTVNKTDIPIINDYQSGYSQIGFTGSQIFNELTSNAERFTPTEYDSKTKTYEYWHNGDKSVYFGITYNYYQVTSTSDQTGILTEAPIYPLDSTATTFYMVKAVITNGSNYNEPTKSTYYGYFTVIKTSITMSTENKSFEYTGEKIDSPEVTVLNSQNSQVTIKYENNASLPGVYVTRTVTKAGSKVSEIRDVGEYVVTFRVQDTEYFTTGSTFEATCIITITPKKIIADDSYITKPDTFVAGLVTTTNFKIDGKNAFNFNSHYAKDKNGSTVFIQLVITNKNDGSGATYTKSSEWSALPAGTYYYYVAPKSGGKIANYVQSDYIEFEIVRKEYTIELIESAKNGITVNYSVSSEQPYSYTNIVVKSNGVSQSSYTQSDFDIQYRVHSDDTSDDGFSYTIPQTNGVYDVRIQLLTPMVTSNVIKTKLTISAPTLEISGNISFVYGLADTTLSISLSATKDSYSDTLTSSIDETTKKYNYTAETSNGYWFVLGYDFGGTDTDYLQSDYNVTLSNGDVVNIKDNINAYLRNNNTTLQYINDLNLMESGSNYLPIFYISKNENFVLSFSLFVTTVQKFTITNDMLSSAIDIASDAGFANKQTSFTSGPTDDADKFRITLNQTKDATSKYDNGWAFEDISISNETYYILLSTDNTFTSSSKENALPSQIILIANVSGTIDGATILDKLTNNTQSYITATLSTQNTNYTISDAVFFNLCITFKKTETTLFASKTEFDGSTKIATYTYGQYFLDEYWANLNEKNKISTSIPDDLPDKANHIFIYDLISTPYTFGENTEDNYNLFRTAWAIDGSNAYNNLYSYKVNPASTNTEGKYVVSGEEVSSNIEYRQDNKKREDSSLYGFYTYKVDPTTNAGYYLVQITLAESNYFLETKVTAVLRIKPTTYILRTSKDSLDGVLMKDGNACPEEQLALYDSAGNLADVSFTAYYKLNGAIKYQCHRKKDGEKFVTDRVDKGTFSDLFTKTQEYTISITVDDDYKNSATADDITVLVIADNIDIGTYDIYGTISLDDLTQAGQPLETLGKLGTFSWIGALSKIFDRTGNSITEDAISLMKYSDGVDKMYNNPTENTDDSTKGTYPYYFDFKMEPDDNHQFVFEKLSLLLSLDSGSDIVIPVKIAINAKLMTTATKTVFTYYESKTHKLGVTAYFQGWNYRILADSEGIPDVDQVVIKEIETDVYDGSPTGVSYTNSSGDTTAQAPTDAGSYTMISTYEVGGRIFVCYNDFTILRQQKTFSVDSKVVLYNGQDQSINDKLPSIEFTLTVTYYDSSNNKVTGLPRNAGVYRAVVQISGSANYYGTAETTLTIKKTATTIVLTLPDNLVYNGNNIKPSYKIYNENNVEITNVTVKETYNGVSNVSSNAGSYTYVLSITGDSNTLPNSATISYTIEKATPQITFTDPANTTYTGSKIVPTISISPVTLASDSCYTITYNGSTTEPVNAGVYRVNVSYNPASTSNYNTVEASYTYTILPSPISVTYDGNSSDKIITLTYSSSMQQSSIRPVATSGANVTYLYEGYTYNADGSLSTTKYSSTTFPTNAGIYTITATPNNANYTGTVVTTLVINRATSSILFSVGSYTYNGSAQAPNISATPSTLAYTVLYTGVNYAGNAYSSTSAPSNAGRYVVTATFGGDSNYTDVKVSQSYSIAKISTATMTFESSSLTQKYTGEELKPTVVVSVNGTANESLASDVVLVFGKTGHTPVSAGSYAVTAKLDSCNFTANNISATFTITKSDDFVISLDNEGTLSLDATRFGSANISEGYEVEYVGKTYLSDGTLSSVNNYNAFVFPAGQAGLYTGTIIADNYEARTFSFEIVRTDLSDKITIPNYSIVLGQTVTLTNTITIDTVTYNVNYTFKLADSDSYTSQIPTTIGEHSMKVTILDKNYAGEKIVTFTITYPNSDASKVVLDSPYYMYTGSDIVVGAKLYLNGISQSNVTKRYKKDGSYVNTIVETGEYEVEMFVEGNNSQVYTATITVVPELVLSVPNSAIYDKTIKTVSYTFARSEDSALHASHITLKITKDNYTVESAINAGSYIASLYYDGYIIHYKTFSISKQTIDSETLGASVSSGISITYGQNASIPTVLHTHNVKYLISYGGTTEYREGLPTVGNHKIKFVIDEENYQGETITTLSVSKKLITINIEDFDTQYTGSTLAMPETLASLEYLSYSYNTTPSNHISGLPTNVGSYYITVTSSSQNYAVKFRDTTRPYIKVNITKSTPDYFVSNLTQTYTGSGLFPSATAVFNGQAFEVQISNTNMVNAGTYTITYSIKDNANFNISQEYTFTIEKADVDITYTLPSNLVYDGTQKSLTAQASIAEVGAVSISVTKNGTIATPVNAGTYIATLSTSATTNYKACTKSVVFAILPADTVVNCYVENYNYTGSAKPVQVTTNPSLANVNITYDGLDSAPSNAGTYTANITVTPQDANYATKTIVFSYTIVKVLDTIDYTRPTNDCFNYDGNQKALSGVRSGSGTHTITYYKYTSGSYSLVNASEVVAEGSYKAVIKTTGNSNYYASEKSVCFVIKKKLIQASITGYIYTYDGSSRSVALELGTGVSSRQVVVKYFGYSYTTDGKCTQAYGSETLPLKTSPTKPGIYTAVLSAVDSTCDIEGVTTASLIINRISTGVKISISGVADDKIIIDYTGNKYTVSATTTTGSATVTTKITRENFDTEVDLQEGGNYEIVSDVNTDVYFGYAKRLISIKPKTATIFAKQTDVGYCNSGTELVYIVVDQYGIDITNKVKEFITTVYYKVNSDNSTTKLAEGEKPKVVGNYIAHITLANASYIANAEYSFTISKSSAYIELKEDADTIQLNNETYTTLSEFNTNTDKYNLVINGKTINNSNYSVTYYKMTYTTVEDPDTGDITTEEAWTEKTAANASETFGIENGIIKNNGAYKLRVKITNTALLTELKANLVDGTFIENDDGEFVIDYLFMVIA